MYMCIITLFWATLYIFYSYIQLTFNSFHRWQSVRIFKLVTFSNLVPRRRKVRLQYFLHVIGHRQLHVLQLADTLNVHHSHSHRMKTSRYGYKYKYGFGYIVGSFSDQIECWLTEGKVRQDVDLYSASRGYQPPLMCSLVTNRSRPTTQATAHSLHTQAWAATWPLARQRQSAVGLPLRNPSLMDY